MKIPEEEHDEGLTKRQLATQEAMLAFLDELTELTRRTGIIIGSEGNFDCPSLRAYDPSKAQKGKYIPFWENAFSYPMDFVWEEEDEVGSMHLIDMDEP